MGGSGLAAPAGKACSVIVGVEHCTQLIDLEGSGGRGGVELVDTALGGGVTVDSVEGVTEGGGERKNGEDGM